MFRAVAVGCVLVLACGKRDAAAPPKQEAKAAGSAALAAAGDRVRPGTLKQPPRETIIGVAIPKGGDVAAAEKLARERGSAAKLEIERMTLDAFGFDRAWVGMSPTPVAESDLAGVEGAEAVIAVRGSGADGLGVVRAVAADASAVADASHGWVLDPGVASMYTADVFRERLPGKDPDIRKLIVVHAVGGEGELPFLDTMGMRRLGLPDLYVKAAGRGQLGRYMTLIDAVAQTMLDRGDVARAGEIEIDLARLHNDWDLSAVRGRGGSGKATLYLQWSNGSGDHGEELSIELVPPKGATPEAAEEVLDACLGQEPDKLAYADDDDPELLAAAKRARSELSKLAPRFKNGVPSDELLSVKAAFRETSGAVEWMWVDVVRLRGKVAVGTLANDPEIVTNVKEGQRVEVKLDDIADYIHEKSDGTTAGGYSIEVFEKRGLLD